MMENVKQRFANLKEKAAKYVNQFKSTEQNLKELLGGGEYSIQNVDFFERSFRVFVGEEKVKRLRTRLDKEDRTAANTIGSENFEVEYSGLELEFDEDIGDVIVYVPVWDEGVKTVFEAAQMFQNELNCKIVDTQGYLDGRINNLEDKMKKHQQLKKDIG